MKNYLYKVKFIDGSESVIYSSNPISAAILASADKIRERKNRNIVAIEDEHGESVSGCLQFTPYKESDL
jgi:hypothetical protein